MGGLLRLATAGNVDDGKSTLIGRLLVDSRAVLEDQLEAAKQASLRRGAAGVDLALLTDGLRAEREQGITIDVAYRYFATARRKFIVADCPGHVQYTRNMVTGVSTAEAAIVLVDVAKELQEQTRRHCLIVSLLRVPHLVVCVNKMDLVAFAEEAFDAVSARVLELAKRLEIENVSIIPISALAGDNVVTRSARTPWYGGKPLLEHLETLERPCVERPRPLRFPVQSAVLGKPGSDYRGYGGFLACGSVAEGDEVVVLPGGARTRVSSVDVGGRRVGHAQAPVSLTLRLADESDVGRGDMIAAASDPPRVARELEAMLCWMSPEPLTAGKRYLIRHTTAEAPVVIEAIERKLDLSILTEAPAQSAGINEFVRVRLRAARPLCHDPYRKNRATGSFVLIDEASFATVAAGMIL
jgi:sulfate adenylyltransferase large subunit